MNSRNNEFYSNGEIDPSTNPVNLTEQAHSFSEAAAIQVCVLGTEGSGKNVAQLYLLHQSQPEESVDTSEETYFDVRVTNALGQFELTLQTVPSAFPSLEAVVIRECDVFFIMYDRNDRQSYEYALNRAHKVLRIQEEGDDPKQFVFVANSKGEDMSFYNLANWISSDSDPIVSRNSGLDLAREFDGVYIETATGVGNEINEALSACLNLHINDAVLARENEHERRNVTESVREMWHGAVCLSRPVRYAFRSGLLTTRLALANRINALTRQ